MRFLLSPVTILVVILSVFYGQYPAFQYGYAAYFLVMSSIVLLIGYAVMAYTRGIVDARIQFENVEEHVKKFILGISLRHHAKGQTFVFRFWIPMLCICWVLLAMEMRFASILFLGISIFAKSTYDQIVKLTQYLYTQDFFEDILP